MKSDMSEHENRILAARIIGIIFIIVETFIYVGFLIADFSDAGRQWLEECVTDTWLSHIVINSKPLGVNISDELKYLGIVLCFLTAAVLAAIRKKAVSILIAIAMFFTGVADYFLLLGDNYLPGVISFFVVQAFYLAVIVIVKLRFAEPERQVKTLEVFISDEETEAIEAKKKGYRSDNIKVAEKEKNGTVYREITKTKAGDKEKEKAFSIIATTILLRIALGLVAAYILHRLLKGDFLLMAAVTAYALSFASNVTRCGFALKRGREQINMPVFFVGLVLFVLCDINVAVFNLDSIADITSEIFISIRNISANLMWLFYLPAQVLIVCSCRNCEK